MSMNRRVSPYSLGNHHDLPTSIKPYLLMWTLTPFDSFLVARILGYHHDSFLDHDSLLILVVLGSKNSALLLYIRTPSYCSWTLSLTWFTIQVLSLPKLFQFPHSLSRF